MKAAILSLFVLVILSPSAFSVGPAPKDQVVPGRIIVQYPRSGPSRQRANRRRQVRDRLTHLFSTGTLSQSTVAGDSQVIVALPHLTARTKGNVEETLRLVRRLRREEKLDAYPDYYVSAAYSVNDPHYPPSSGAWGQSFADQWGHQKLDTEHAWDLTRGDGQLVAVIDTGVDYTHPDLDGRVVKGWNFVKGTNDPRDDHGHGTHVAGIVGATANNAIGIAGVAPESRILAVKVLNQYGTGILSAVADGIRYAADNGATVINLSLGASLTEVPPYLTDAVRYAHDLGVVVIAAAGNSATEVSTFTPASDPNAIAVSAFDHADVKASFSNFGTRISLAAPGGGGTSPSGIFDPHRSVLSLLSSIAQGSITGNGQLVVGASYLRQAGTSMAAPHVAGTAALVRAFHPSYTVEQVRQALTHGSDDVAQPGFDPQSGYGRVNALKALVEPEPLAVHIASPLTVLTGAIVSVSGTVGGPNLSHWELQYGVSDTPAAWTTIVGGTVPLSNALISDWDLTTVPDGAVTLRLRAETTAGSVYEHRINVTVDHVALTAPDPLVAVFVRSGAIIDIRGKVSPALFSSYTVIVNRSNGQSMSAAITPVNGGNSPVEDGSLATWDTTGVTADKYTITLRVSLTTGAIIQRQTKINVDPTLRSGWPVQLGASGAGGGFSLAVIDHVTAADLNGDGRKEILVAYGDTIHAYTENGTELPGWPRVAGITNFQTGPVVADLNGDGRPEVIAAAPGGLFAWHADGIPVAGFPKTIFTQSVSLAATDIDGDGRAEIMLSNSHVTVFDGAGNVRPGWPFTGGFIGPWSPVAVGDTDGDGVKEIAVMNVSAQGGNHSLYLLGANGTTLTGWPRLVPANGSSYLYTRPVMADIDGDGALEMVVAAGTGVHAFKADGTAVAGFPRTLSGAAHGPTVGDITGDGRPEIIVGSAAVYEGSSRVNYLHVFQGDGTNAPGFPVRHVVPAGSGSFFFGMGTSAVADVTGDGIPELVVSSDVGGNAFAALHAYKSDGTEAPGFPKLTADVGAWEMNTPAVADITGTGTKSLVWIDVQRNIYTWDLTASGSGTDPWPMYGHDEGHTHTLAAAIVPPPPPPPVPPATPSNLSATAVSTSRIDLAWQDNSHDESGFRVERGSSENGPWATLASPTADVTSYADTGLPPGANYFYRIVAFNTAGDSDFSNVATATTVPLPPAAPSSLTATAVSTSQISLAWQDNSHNETGFRIERGSSENGPWATLASPAADATTYADTGLPAGTTYFYRILGFNAGGDSTFSNTVSATTIPLPPAPPSGLTATAVSTSQINLAWQDNSHNEQGFRMEWAPSASGPWATLGSLGAGTTAWSHSNLSPGTTYHYRVLAYNSGGSSGFSNTASATTIPLPPAAPSNPTATAVSSVSIRVSWRDNSLNESDFHIQRGSTKNGPWQDAGIAAMNAINHTVSGLAPNSVYWFRVRARNSGGNSVYTAPVSARTLVAPPAAPYSLTVTRYTRGALLLRWKDAANNEKGFQIERSLNATTWTRIASVGTNVKSYLSKGLSPGVRYYYRVRAYNAGGYSGYTNVASAIAP